MANKKAAAPQQDPRRTELHTLLDAFRRDDGTLPRRKAYLNTEKGKRILELVIELELSWPEIVGLLERERTNIHKAISWHGLSKARKPPAPAAEYTSEDLDTHIMRLVKDELILVEHSVDELHRRVKASHPKETPPKRKFRAYVESLIWTTDKNGTLTTFREIVKHGVPLERFRSLHPYIPIEWLRTKEKKLTGETEPKITPAQFVRGINRLGGEEGLSRVVDFQIPATSSEKPFTVETADPHNWRFVVVNGANIGIKHGRVIEENPVRQAFSTAERLGCDAVFLTNTLDIDMAKAMGPIRALRALSSGREVNTAIMDPSYQEEARRILSEMPDDEVVYETANEAFEDLMTGWHKITRLPDTKPYDGKPEFSGKVFVVLGHKEENFIVAATYWTIAYHTIVKRSSLEAELKATRGALANAQDPEQRQELEHKVERLSAQIARTRITPVHPQEWQRFYPQVLAHVIRRFEEAIPNCTVIGINTTRVQYGAKSVELSIPDHERVNDMLLSERVKTHGPQTLREELADATIVCHPYALNTRVTARERDARGERGHAFFAVAPMCVDGEFLRRELKHVVRKAHPVNKAVFNEQFKPGSLLVECINNVLQPPEELSIGMLDKSRLRTKDFTTRPRVWGRRTDPLPELPDTSYIWYWMSTDPHIGSRNRESIWCAEAGERLGMFEAVCHLMRREGLFEDGAMPPVHLFSSNDDLTQGNHFGTHMQPHPHELSYMEIQDRWGKAMEQARNARTKRDALKVLADMREETLYQLEVRGLDWTQQQIMAAFERLIERDIDAYDGILRRAEHADLVVRGISEFEGIPKDSRDIGIINHGTGNHFTKTLERRMAEGPLFADKCRTLLAALPHWQDKAEVLEKLVRAPIDGNRFIGYGTVEAPGGYVWGVDMRDTPTGGVDWNDPLRKTVAKEMSRGNPSRILEGKTTVATYGDKHFLSFITTPWRIFLMGPPGTHTDVFGELGFPPNNTGVVFLGLPVDGPDGGPILLRTLLFDDVKRLIEEQRPFDWSRFLPNPA